MIQILPFYVDAPYPNLKKSILITRLYEHQLDLCFDKSRFRIKRYVHETKLILRLINLANQKE